MRQVKKAQTRKHLTIEPLIAKELENTIPTHENGRAMRITKAEALSSDVQMNRRRTRL
jgi:hypothetical protein